MEQPALGPPPELLNLTEFQSPLLDAADSLRSLGVQCQIDIPQLIVVGEQGAGKSSVLEAISGVRFAVDVELCTRFPIEIALRRSAETSITASIRPGSLRVAGSAEYWRLREFSRVLRSEDFQHLPELIKEAGVAMGVVSKPSQDLQGIITVIKEFTDDILRIELRGPKYQPLTLVDLPGLYQSSTERVPEGMKLVKQLAWTYMKEKQSIILKVVPATFNPTAQEISSMAKEVDPEQERTLGVITRPDRVPTGRESQKIVCLAKNNLIPLKLGWHTLRNKSDQERLENVPDDQRDKEEENFLSSREWADVPAKDKGIGALRMKLCDLLVKHIKSNLPELIRKVAAERANRKLKLERLGEPRKTLKDKLKFLAPMTMGFVRLAESGISGNYTHKFFGFPGDRSQKFQERRIRANINELSLTFDVVMRRCGKRVDLVPTPEPTENLGMPATSVASGELSDSESELSPTTDYLPRNNLLVDDINGVAKALRGNVDSGSGIQSSVRFEDLQSCVLPRKILQRYMHREPIPVTRASMEAFLCTEMARWKGLEASEDTNSSLAKALFKRQAGPWKSIVDAHATAVWSTAYNFVDSILQHTVEKSVLTGVRKHIAQPTMKKVRKRFNRKCGEILECYMEVNPSLYTGHLDIEGLKRSAQATAKRLDGYTAVLDDQGLLDDDAHPITVGRSVSASRSLDLVELCHSASLKLLIGGINSMAVENYLLKELPQIFSTERLYELDENIIELAAQEPKEIEERRQKLGQEISLLDTAMEILRKFYGADMDQESELDFSVDVLPSGYLTTTSEDSWDGDESSTE